jgi:conjugative relaxase-like TrwC/TraI family protein
MLRMSPVASAKRAEDYYGKSDGGYYVGESDLRRRWGGKGAELLELKGAPDFEQFKRLIHGLDPHTGEQLTAKLIAGRLCGWDVTACVPKGATSALERGDERIQDKIWEAGEEAMALLEQYATTRVRVGGQQTDRVTGNLIWYGVEHPETRPVLDPSRPQDDPWRAMPDWDRHIHFFIPNLTYDQAEDKWKAVKFRPIMDIRKYFDRCFDTILASKMAGLGYELETKWKPDGKYYSWDIKGIPDSVIEKNSRRSAEVEQTEQTILGKMKQENGHAPEQLSAVARDKLGATSRQEKRDDLTLEECRRFWNSRITPEEGDAIAETIRRARLGLNPRPEPGAARAVDFAMRHQFEQRSVVPWEELATTAMEQSVGTALPDELLREFLRQGVIMRMKGGTLQCTTQALQKEEDGIIGFAAGGQGKVLPVGLAGGLHRTLGNGTVLNDGQFQAVVGLLNSPNRVNMVQGPAGAGKSSMLAKFDEGVRRMGQHVTYLGTTAPSVKVLEKDGFEANTLARFLLDDKLQAAARGGRVVIDETSLLGHKDAVRLFDIAKRDDLKLIFVGDPMQHGSVPRGAFMRLLTEYAGVQPFHLREILRQQSPAYRAAAKLLSEGKTVEGFDALDHLGWVKELGDDQRYAAIAADYLQALNEKKSVLVVSPTHKEAAIITDAIRSTLRDAGKLGSQEREFTRLVQVNASDAERGRREMYQPGDVLQFHQNAVGHKKGDRLVVTDPAGVPIAEAAKFAVYRPEKVSLAVGDVIRFTGTVKTLNGDHVLKNGAVKTVAGFDTKGNLRLDNGWVVSKDAGHFRSGFVETSFGSQGRTVQRVILGMAAASLPATNQEQLYVSSSRAKESLRLYTDSKAEIREGVQRSSQKLVASDLTGHARKRVAKPSRLDRLRQFMARRRRLGIVEHMRAAWNRSGRSRPVPPRTPPRSPGTHTSRVMARQEERDTGRGR